MWAKVEEHYNKNVWHQLTIQLQLIPIYQEFIMEFEATVVLDRFTSSEEAIVFLEKIGEKVNMNSEARCWLAGSSSTSTSSTRRTR